MVTAAKPYTRTGRRRRLVLELHLPSQGSYCASASGQARTSNQRLIHHANVIYRRYRSSRRKEYSRRRIPSRLQIDSGISNQTVASSS